MARLNQPLVLIADDDPAILRALGHHMSGWGCRVATAVDKRELLELLGREVPQLLLLDLQFGEHDGTQLLQEIRQVHSELPIIILTAHGTIDTAVSAIKFGATDYLTKPPDLNRLQVVLKNAQERDHLTRRIRALEQLLDTGAPRQLTGTSPVMRVVDELMTDVAPTDATVLILGESGTGKELVAQIIHERSTRRQGPFIPLNMAALPSELVESTLFGHEKGSFTSADAMQIGCCEAADKGTLFLDEIGEMDVNLQAKLLRFLQEQTFNRVGSSQPRKVDVRIIAATNQDPIAQIKSGELREDLYYRLNVVPIHVPPLRQRLSDVPQLAELFLQRAASRNRKPNVQRFSPETLDILSRYTWPGNVRELENLVQRMVILCRGNEIEASLIPLEIREAALPPALPVTVNGVDTMVRLPGELMPEGGLRAMDQIERNAILEALKKSNNNVREAAKILGLGQATVYRKLKKYDIKT